MLSCASSFTVGSRVNVVATTTTKTSSASALHMIYDDIVPCRIEIQYFHKDSLDHKSEGKILQVLYKKLKVKVKIKITVNLQMRFSRNYTFNKNIHRTANV